MQSVSRFQGHIAGLGGLCADSEGTAVNPTGGAPHDVHMITLRVFMLLFDVN